MRSIDEVRTTSDGCDEVDPARAAGQERTDHLVWCLIGGLDGRAEVLAEALIGAGHTVAMPRNDVSPLAMLVNRYWDAVLPVEIDGVDHDTLERATAAIEENYGAIDVFAVLLDSPADGFDEAAARVFAGLRPAVTVLLLTGGLQDDPERRGEQRAVDAVLRAEIHRRRSSEHVEVDRRIVVVALTDCLDAVGA